MFDDKVTDLLVDYQRLKNAVGNWRNVTDTGKSLASQDQGNGEHDIADVKPVGPDRMGRFDMLVSTPDERLSYVDALLVHL